jgi:hypothetical protein
LGRLETALHPVPKVLDDDVHDAAPDSGRVELEFDGDLADRVDRLQRIQKFKSAVPADVDVDD